MGKNLNLGIAAPSLRLEVAPGGRYLRDAASKAPFQIRGSSTWCIVQLTREDVDLVLDDTKAKKFNSIVIMSALSENALTQYGPAQAYGLSPFTDSKLTPSTAFWAHLDYIIDGAARRGLVVQLAFLYLGHATAQDGFASRVSGCTTGECTAFGEWLGAHYASRKNIIWVCGGDNQSNWDSKWQAIADGILSQDSNHLITGHPARAQEGRNFGSFITLNTSYRARTEVASGTLTAYQGTPTLPVFAFEMQYEGDGTPFSNPTLTAMQTRVQSWQAMLSGGCGANFGNHPVWTCGYVNGSLAYPNWKTTDGLNSTGHQHMVHLHNFFERIKWHTLAPDANSLFVTSGRSSAENYVAAAHSDKLGVCVIPAGGAITVDKGVFSGSLLVRQFDPTNGQFTVVDNSDVTPLTNSGTLNLDPGLNSASDTDMVYLFEAA